MLNVFRLFPYRRTGIKIYIQAFNVKNALNEVKGNTNCQKYAGILMQIFKLVYQYASISIYIEDISNIYQFYKCQNELHDLKSYKLIKNVVTSSFFGLKRS